MQFNQPTPARGEGGDDHLIPLINIVFLMLIFFMIAGQIVPTDSLKIEPPSSSIEQPAPPEDIAVLVDTQGHVAVNGEAVSLEELAARLKQLLSAGDMAQAPQIALKVDAQLAASELSKVLDALREAEATKVTLFTIRGNP